jgi:hypothetical protein
MTDIHPHDDLAVYALDALDPHEREAVDAHLADCPECRAELDGYLETLGRMTVPEEPPDHVWTGIASQIRSPAPAPAATPTRSPSAPATPSSGGVVVRPARWQWMRSPGKLAAAAAVIVVLALGAVVVASQGGSGGIRGEAESAAGKSGATVVKLTTGDRQDAARVVITKGADYVIFDQLPKLPSSKTYQLWRTDEGVPSSLGVLGPGS